ncbi:MAG TPA: NUDIX domain-containing protein [Patescibacteria group bacterium]|nr:NUDIX domain-containing protein [Patescibacteria group bacterium]
MQQEDLEDEMQSSKNRLFAKFPETKVVQTLQELAKEDFENQKAKQLEYDIEGGAIGVVWVSPTEVVLTRRTKPHGGWALPGGRVEKGEDFDDAFLREVEEETSVKAVLDKALQLEEKIFISPAGEKLPFVLASFEATALPGQTPILTIDAVREGLEVAVFDVNSLPEQMVLQDRQKIELALAARQT